MGIQTMIHYPVPPHKQKAYHEWNELNFAITEKIHAEVLSLPLSQINSLEEIDFVTRSLNAFQSSYGKD
jgi:dTDP-4-amino-4,6-dideoxygalactose transaminase